MQIIRDPKQFQQTCCQWRNKGLKTALVPTMGFLHQGHLALMDKAARLGDATIATIFVNPTQFGPNEDLDRYPRAFERDCKLAKEHGVKLLFAPEPETMYHPDHATWVEVPKLAQGLCAASRPDHFKGVCTVVSKLFHLANPAYAVFGQKDWQQLAIIRRMVRDLDFAIKIVGVPIVREPDGLALSSRNVNLDKTERAQAPNIFGGLKNMQTQVKDGEKNGAILLTTLRAHYAKKLPAAEPDYLQLVHPDTLEQVEVITAPTLVAVALKMNHARLIDNLLLEV